MDKFNYVLAIAHIFVEMIKTHSSRNYTSEK